MNLILVPKLQIHRHMDRCHVFRRVQGLGWERVRGCKAVGLPPKSKKTKLKTSSNKPK